ncbi:MAG: T9SS type A sorting domain-containing protein [Bacteroidales bacterium]|nr:T9SS type A sorting domain-containing protein [Bacteroidales bacterium]
MKNFYFLLLIVLSLFVSVKAQQWTAITTPSTTGVDYLTVADNKLFLASKNGIFTSTDGTNWSNSSNGMTLTSGFTFSANIFNFNNVLYSGAMGTIYKSIDYGANWTKITGSAPSASALNTTLFVNGDTIYSGWKSSGMYSTANGTNWYQGTGDGIAGKSIDKDLVYHKGNIFVKTPSGVYKSTNKGNTFKLLTGGGLPAMSGNVGGLTVCNDVLICAVFLIGVYISIDEGVSWIDKTPSGVTLKNFNTLEVCNGTVYMGCTGGMVFKSNDNGYTWDNISGIGLGSDAIQCFEVYKGDLYAGGIGSLYKTSANTAINNQSKESSQFSVYPNPTFEQIIVETNILNNSTFEILNIEGKIVYRLDLLEKRTVIALNHLAEGLYYVKLKSLDGIFVKKFIKH